jgi:hypothetical protein
MKSYPRLKQAVEKTYMQAAVKTFIQAMAKFKQNKEKPLQHLNRL